MGGEHLSTGSCSKQSRPTALMLSSCDGTVSSHVWPKTTSPHSLPSGAQAPSAQTSCQYIKGCLRGPAHTARQQKNKKKKRGNIVTEDCFFLAMPDPPSCTQ